MKQIIVVALILISIAFAQEAKIDSVAIQAKMAELEVEYNKATEQIAQLEEGKKQIAFAHAVLSQMLVPSVVKEEEENEKK